MVYNWHFTHFNTNHYDPPPAYPLSVLSEGHTGVALFMVLSGYLFAKLTFGKQINYGSFLWNRFLRLAPLLFLVFAIVGVVRYVTDQDMGHFATEILHGFIRPTWPNGGWSITAEFHFYLVLPLLLFVARKNRMLLFLILGVALCARLMMYQKIGQIHTLSYWTIVGRIDQFLLGIAAYYFREHIRGRHLLALLVFMGFAAFYRYFDLQGGFMENPSYPSPSSLWIYLPTMEGLAYAFLIAWYDQSFRHSSGPISRFVAAIGTYSYSIYLLHFFVVFKLAHAINDHLIVIDNFYRAWWVSTLSFCVMIPLGYISYRFFESWFLRYRTRYLVQSDQQKKPPENADSLKELS